MDCNQEKSERVEEIAALHRRISALERSVEAGLISEQCLAGIINFLPDATLVIDRKGKVIAWNRAMEAVTGVRAEAMLGKGDYEYALPFYGKRRPILIDMVLNRADDTPVQKNYTRIEHHGDVHLAEAYTPDLCGDHDRYISATASVLKDRRGNVIGAIECMRDNTERRRLEKKLLNAEKRYLDLVDHSPLGIYYTNGAGEILYANQALADILGYSAAELISTQAMSHLGNEDIRRDIYEKLRATGQCKNHESTLRTRNGEERQVYLNAVSDHDVVAGTVMDITRRIRAEEENRRLQEQLTRVQKMEAIGTLAGGVAHDFNNILMGIQGHTQLMLFTLHPEHPCVARLEKIAELVTSGAKLSQQLLGFARGGKYELRPLNINRLLERTLSMFDRTEKDLLIHKMLQEDIWTVDADYGQIEQVFLNLFINASQAMPNGGELSIETGNVYRSEQEMEPFVIPPGRYVRIAMTDTGVGMDEKTAARIFDPFFTTKPSGHGAGLGLASAYGIVKNHGGFISVTSELGRGSTFYVNLPASDKAPVAQEETQEELLTGGETVLLVDDEENIKEVIKESLESLGYRVLDAGSGREAVEIYTAMQGKIDLVILDMIMPGMSGAKTFERLREIDPAVRVVIASGYGAGNQVRHVMENGCRGFLQKPFNLSEMSRKVREVLDRVNEDARVAS